MAIASFSGPGVRLREGCVQQREQALLPRQGSLQVARARQHEDLLPDLGEHVGRGERAPMATCVTKNGCSPLITMIFSPTRPITRANWSKPALHAFML